VLRRGALVYQESAVKLRSSASAIAPEALQKTAKLFRAFGEEYHEQKLEEAFIFPAVQKPGNGCCIYGVLTAQHQRGRELTDYILAATSAQLSWRNVEPLARVMESLVRMYEHHAASKTTIIFPAWKQSMTLEQMDVMNDKFEEIENEQFGKDGFEMPSSKWADIEVSLGLADLGQFTAAPPPALPETKPQEKQIQKKPAQIR